MTTDILKTSRNWAAAKSGGWLLVVDDHPLFCDALELTLRSVMPGHDVKTAASLEQALRVLEANPAPHLVALDLNLPDVSGVDGVMQIRRAVGQVPIIIISSLDDNRVVTSVMKAGASGFVPKHSARAVFELAIGAINRGEAYLPDAYRHADDADPEAADAVERLALLTTQQSRILQLICEGKLNKQIAYDLSIAETTVKAHVTAIMRKLGVQSRTQAVLVSQQAKFSAILPET